MNQYQRVWRAHLPSGAAGLQVTSEDGRKGTATVLRRGAGVRRVAEIEARHGAIDQLLAAMREGKGVEDSLRDRL